MGTAERRLEILKYLCKYKYAKMSELAEKFGVSRRTIQRDIYEIECIFYLPIKMKHGKYEGGVYVEGDIDLHKLYERKDKILLLNKVKRIAEKHLSNSEMNLLENIIKDFSKSA